MPDILTIQPSDIDTLGWEANPDTNYGTHTLLSVRTQSGTLRHSILRFDFSALPAGAIISGASLSLYLESGDSTGRTYWAYELTQTGWTEAGATWNKYDGTNAWATAGGDYTTTDGASLEVPEAHNWMNWNVLALVQHFQSAHGKVANFLLIDGTEGDLMVFSFLYSNNYTGDLTLRPKLVVTYSPATHYTLTAEAGSYTKTGQGAGLRAARKIAAGSDSYGLTGQSVGLRTARKIAAGAGSYSLTGQDAALRAARKLAAAGGSYVLAGQPANLVLGLYHYRLVAEAGYYGEPYSKVFVTLDGRIYKKIGDTYLRLS